MWLKESERKHADMQRKVLKSKEIKFFPGEAVFLQ